ncbi:hypothetical protein [Bradyrhizobium elkanii]|uniref:hypothetical protein n=1 Tax=Bradyrhizobium elkanii TaxID=29448 RepID=UPI003516D776
MIFRDGAEVVPFESLIERDWLIRTDTYDHDLRWIVAQPRVDEEKRGLPYWFDGRMRVWIPDFMRQRRGRDGLQDPRPDLVEVKPLIAVHPEDSEEAERELKCDYVVAKFEAIRMAALARGYGFSLATEDEIRIQPSLRNADLMRRCAGKGFPERWEVEGRLAVLRLPHESSIRELERVLPTEIDAFSVALRLAWRGEIVLAPMEDWTRATTFARV